MKTVKLDVNKFDGLAITVEIEGGIDKYAKSFLHIFNNVRESRELFKVTNYYDSNDVTVYCEHKEETKEALVKYLKNFGEIKSIEKVLMYQIVDMDEMYSDEYEGVEIVPYFEF